MNNGKPPIRVIRAYDISARPSLILVTFLAVSCLIYARELKVKISTAMLLQRQRYCSFRSTIMIYAYASSMLESMKLRRVSYLILLSLYAFAAFVFANMRSR